MLLANVYLLCWDYKRLKAILPFKQPAVESILITTKTTKNKFPFLFFGGVFLAAATAIVVNNYIFIIRPVNSLLECTNVCKESDDPKACEQFCDCIYNKGGTLDKCLAEFKKAR